jgi:hypothetical protein
MENEEQKEKQRTAWHINPLDVEEMGLRNADIDYNGNLSGYIRQLIRDDDIKRQNNLSEKQKIKKIGLLQIVIYLFISTDLLLIAIAYFSSTLLVMAITIASGALLFLYSGVMIRQRYMGVM